MAHGYSLRSNTKGRRGHKSADEIDDQVEPEGDSGIVDPRPTGTNSELDTPETAHQSPAPTQDSEDQKTEDLETGEDIQAAREREDALLYKEAVRIQREQAAHRYEEELYWLRRLRVQTEVIRQESEARLPREPRRRRGNGRWNGRFGRVRRRWFMTSRRCRCWGWVRSWIQSAGRRTSAVRWRWRSTKMTRPNNCSGSSRTLARR